jgi:multidrug resistance protein, MATE family
MSITKYPEGSVRELWSVAAPLMLSSFSLLAMVFVDRVFLAHYSVAAMAATVTSGTAAWALLGSLTILTSMAEVFVAQFNGAQMFCRIGRPVWQAVWLSVWSAVALIPLALWGGQLLFRDPGLAEYERIYWKWFLLLGWSFPLQGALAAFFVGRGKTRLVMLLALGANVANVVLDWLLIFGIEGVLAPQGVRGAAIATTVGNLLQVAVLIALFLRPEYRTHYATKDAALDLRQMGALVRVGAPQATLFFIECVGFALFYTMIARAGPEQIFVAGAAQSVLICLLFAAEGIGRGAGAISGNLIGAGRPLQAFKVFRSGLKIHLLIFILASLFLVVHPQWFADLFLAKLATWFSENPQTAAREVDMAVVEGMLRFTLHLCLFYLFFEGVRWLVSGILTSAGDTLFLLITGAVTVPFFLLLPTYILVERMQLGVVVAFGVCVGFSFLTSSTFLLRFYGKKWATQKLTDLGPEPASLVSEEEEESRGMPG